MSDPTVQDCLADPLIAWIKHPAFTDLLVIWHDPMVTKNLSRRKRNKPNSQKYMEGITTLMINKIAKRDIFTNIRVDVTSEKF